MSVLECLITLSAAASDDELFLFRGKENEVGNLYVLPKSRHWDRMWRATTEPPHSYVMSGTDSDCSFFDRISL